MLPNGVPYCTGMVSVTGGITGGMTDADCFLLHEPRMQEKAKIRRSLFKVVEFVTLPGLMPFTGLLF